MIHSLRDCSVKLNAILDWAKEGVQNSRDVAERTRFENIEAETKYLLFEVDKEEEERIAYLRSYMANDRVS